MRDRRYGNTSHGQHAQRQIRELGQAVRRAAREVERSYPNAQHGDPIIRDFQQQTNRIVESGRQRRNRSLAGSRYQSGHSSLDLSVLIVGLLLLLKIAFWVAMVWMLFF
jgi:hypothetical protein